jgi:hypothetical protein
MTTDSTTVDRPSIDASDVDIVNAKFELLRLKAAVKMVETYLALAQASRKQSEK